MVSSPENPPIALITGGSSGIGLAAAVLFASKGYRIALCGRRVERLSKAAKRVSDEVPESQVMVLAADFAKAEAAAEFVDAVRTKWGHVDVLVNSAGQAHLSAVRDMSDEAFYSLLTANLHSTFTMCRAVIPGMLSCGRGCIINVSSLAAVDPFPGLAVYGACKAWIDLFTLALANELRPAGIPVFAVRPGAVETPMLRGLFPDYPTDQALSPDDVAGLIFHLTDPACAHSSGAAIPIRVT